MLSVLIKILVAVSFIYFVIKIISWPKNKNTSDTPLVPTVFRLWIILVTILFLLLLYLLGDILFIHPNNYSGWGGVIWAMIIEGIFIFNIISSVILLLIARHQKKTNVQRQSLTIRITPILLVAHIVLLVTLYLI